MAENGKGLLSTLGLDNIAGIPQSPEELQAIAEMRRKKREEAAAILLAKQNPVVQTPTETPTTTQGNYKPGQFDVPAPTSFGGKLLHSVFGSLF